MIRVKKIFHEGAYFWMRGLTAGEYVELMESNRVKSSHFSPTIYLKIGLLCMVDWEDIVTENGPLEFNEENKNLIPDEILSHLGRIAYDEMSVLSKELEKKIEGYIHFIYFLNPQGDNVKTEKYRRRELYTCSHCIENGYWEGRLCGKTSSERDSIAVDKRKKKRSASQKKNRNARYGMDLPGKRRGREHKKDKVGLEIDGFDFPECPVSWIQGPLEALIDRLMYCNRVKINYFDGGLASQPNQIYLMQRLIEDTMSRLDAKIQEGNSNANKNTRRKDRMGRRGDDG